MAFQIPNLITVLYLMSDRILCWHVNSYYVPQLRKSYFRKRMTTYKPEEEAQILSNKTKLFCILLLFVNLDSKLRQ